MVVFVLLRSLFNLRLCEQRTMAAIPPPAQILAMIVTPDEMMHKGLKLGGFNERQIKNAGLALKYTRFKSWFGSHPVVYAQIWEDLLTTEIVEARILPKHDVDYFLMALYFLKTYPNEELRSGMLKLGEKTVRKWTWYFVEKMSALKALKVSFAASDQPCSDQSDNR
jgi:hypothetical protein